VRMVSSSSVMSLRLHILTITRALCVIDVIKVKMKIKKNVKKRKNGGKK